MREAPRDLAGCEFCGQPLFDGKSQHVRCCDKKIEKLDRLKKFKPDDSYFLVLHSDDDGATIERFHDFESRKIATCKAIYGHADKEQIYIFENYEMKSLKEKGFVTFEGDPHIEWLKGVEFTVSAR